MTSTYAQSWNIITYKTQDGLSEEFVTNITADNVGFVWLMTNSSVIRFDGNSFQIQDIGMNGRPLCFFKSFTTDSNYVLTANFKVYTLYNGKLLENNWLKNTSNVYLTLGQLAFELNINSQIAFQKLIRDIKNPEFIKYVNNKYLYPINAYSFYGLLPGGKIHIYNHQLKYNPTKETFRPGSHLFMRNKELVVIDHKAKRAYTVSTNHTSHYTVSEHDWKLFQKLSQVGAYNNPYFTDNSSVYHIEYRGSSLALKCLFKIDEVHLIKDVKFCSLLNIYYVASSHGFHVVRQKYFHHLVKENTPNIVSVLMPINNMLVVPSNFIYNGTPKMALKVNQMNNSMLFKDTFENLYYTYQGQLLRYNPKQDKVSTVDTGYTQGSHMTYDAAKNIWISDFYNIYKYYENQRQHICNTIENKATINKFLLIENKSILIATTKGLFKYDLNRRRKAWVLLEGFEVRDLTKDSCYVLVSTYGKGIYRYDIQSDELIQINVDANLPLSYAHAFILDTNNTYWIPTNNGVVRIPRNELIQSLTTYDYPVNGVHYNRIAGLENMEMNGGASPCAVLHDNKIYMASMKGVVCFNPYTIPLPVVNPYIGIEEVTADGKKVSAKVGGLLELPSTTKLIKFKINTPCVLTSSQNLVEYRIVKLDSVWIPLNQEKSIDLLGVPYGKYELEIRKRISNNTVKFSVVTFEFVIEPHYYQTWWFNGLMAFIVLLFAFSLALFRTFILKKQNQVLQSEVNVQTNDLRESKNQTDLLLSVLAHDIRSPLKSLEYIAAHIRSKLNDEEIKDLLTKMEVSLKSIYEFTSNHLIWYTLVRDNFTINLSTINLSKVLNEVVDLYKVALSERKNTVQLFISDEINLSTDEDALKVILRNLIDNANKHTENGFITITGMMFQETCELQISNPLLLDTADVEGQIRPYFELSRPDIQKNQKQNLGIQIIAQLCSRLKYQFTYSINHSRKTITFLLTIPLNDKRV